MDTSSINKFNNMETFKENYWNPYYNASDED